MLLNGQQINAEFFKDTQSFTKTAHYFMRVYVIKREEDFLITDSKGTKLGSYPNLERAEKWIKDFEDSTGAEARRYLHCAS